VLLVGESTLKMVEQAYNLGLGDQFEEVKQKYTEANEVVGDIVKVSDPPFFRPLTQ